MCWLAAKMMVQSEIEQLLIEKINKLLDSYILISTV